MILGSSLHAIDERKQDFVLFFDWLLCILCDSIHRVDSILESMVTISTPP